MPSLRPCSYLIYLPIAGIKYVWSQVLGSPLCELFLLELCHFLVVCVALNLFLTPGIKRVYPQCVTCIAAWSKGVCIKTSWPCQLHCRILFINGIYTGKEPLCCCWFCFSYCCSAAAATSSVSLSVSISLSCLSLCCFEHCVLQSCEDESTWSFTAACFSPWKMFVSYWTFFVTHVLEINILTSLAGCCGDSLFMI